MVAAHSLVHASLVKALLQPKLYGAKEVGYTYDITSTARGLTLSFSGLSDQTVLRGIIDTTMPSKWC